MTGQPDIAGLGDDALLRAVASGNRQAFVELYRRFAPRMLGLIATILRDRHAAHDALQDALLSLWSSNAAAFDPSLGSAQSWVLRVARSRAIDALRRDARRPKSALPDTEDGLLTPARGTASDSTLSPRLREAIDALPDDEREPLLLAYAFGYSRDQIAAHLNSPVGTVKTRIRRATSRLRELVEADGSALSSRTPSGNAP